MRKRATLLLVAILAFQCILQVRANPTWTWNTQVVDPRGSGGRVAIDSHDNPHIVYSVISISGDGLTTSLNYAQWTGKNWTIQTIDEQGASGIIALDSHNKPHILYRNYLLAGNLKYATWNGTNWAIETIAESGVVGYAIAVDSDDNPHIAYAYTNYSGNTYTTDLRYLVAADSDWNVQTIDTMRSNFRSGLAPYSLVLDSKGNPHVAYAENLEYEYYHSKSHNSKAYVTTSNIKYAAWTGSNWNIQTVGTNASTTNAKVDLVLDSKAQPHLCYIHENSMYLPDYGTFMVEASLNYVYWDGVAWRAQAIDSEAGAIRSGQYKLRLDSNDNPVVYFYKENYQNTTDSGLIRANLIDSGWSLQTIGSHDFKDMAFDSSGNPHIIYDMWLGGSIRGAPIRSNLTYASLVTTPISITSLLIIIIAVTTVVIILLLYFIKRKH